MMFFLDFICGCVFFLTRTWCQIFRKKKNFSQKERRLVQNWRIGALLAARIRFLCCRQAGRAFRFVVRRHSVFFRKSLSDEGVLPGFSFKPNRGSLLFQNLWWILFKTLFLPQSTIDPRVFSCLFPFVDLFWEKVWWKVLFQNKIRYFWGYFS